MKLHVVLLLGALLRLALFAFLPEALQETLRTRVELVSPSSSFSSLREALYLSRLHQSDKVPSKKQLEASLVRGTFTSPSPWESGHVHHSPILVWTLARFVPTEAIDLGAIDAKRVKRRREEERRARIQQAQKEQELRRSGADGEPPAKRIARIAELHLRLAIAAFTDKLRAYHYLWIALDVLAAALLATIESKRAKWRNKYGRIRNAREAELEAEAAARKHTKAASTRRSSQGSMIDSRTAKVGAVYLFNPLSILSTLALSSVSISNFSVIFTISVAASLSNATAAFSSPRGSKKGGKIFLYSLLLSAALGLNIVLWLYPVLLAPPLILLARRDAEHSAPSALAKKLMSRLTFRLVLFTVFSTAGLLYLSLLPPLSSNPRQVLERVYIHLITLPDLTPNIGLWWYFFIEMFDHFRNFFLLAFNVHLASYVVPLSIKYSGDPLFATTILSGILAVFKSYPTLGDTALYLSLLSLHPEIYPYLRYPTVTALLYTYSLLLLPLFHHLWLHAGSGNANFFYAITLVWALAGSSSILDAMWAWGRLAWEREREADISPLHADGKHKRVVVQL